MTISQDEMALLRELGFKLRKKNRFTLYSLGNQFIAVNVQKDGFQLEVQNIPIISEPLSFNNLTVVLNLLFINESRKRI